MRPPLAGRRESARRLAGELRRRLEPIERILPVRLPGTPAASDRSPASADGASPPAPEPKAAIEPDTAPEADAAIEPDTAPEPDAAIEPDTADPSAEDATTSAAAPDMAARIDAARARLRESIVPPGDGED